MRKLLVLFCVALMGMHGCAGTTDVACNSVAVSILPLKFLVDDISGGNLDVVVIVPPGGNPETFELTPSVLAATAKSRVIFTTGLIGFEQEIVGRLPQSDACTVVDLSEGIVLVGDGHKNHGADPHIWLSPANLKKMSETVYRSLALLYPDSTEYHANYLGLQARLDDLHSAVYDKINSCQMNEFLIYHPTLTYYAADYGLRQIAIEEDGKEPSAARMKHVVDVSKEVSICKILYQKELNVSIVAAVAADIGAMPVAIDPLREDLIDNILEITDHIATR